MAIGTATETSFPGFQYAVPIPMPIDSLTVNNSGFAVQGNGIEVPEDGLYYVKYFVDSPAVNSDTAGQLSGTINLLPTLNGSFIINDRVGVGPDIYTTPSQSIMIPLKAGDVISLESYAIDLKDPSGNLSLDVSTAMLELVKVGDYIDIGT